MDDPDEINLHALSKPGHKHVRADITDFGHRHSMEDIDGLEEFEANINVDLTPVLNEIESLKALV
jgi:hypothetical protein